MSEEQMEKLRQALIGAKKEEGLEATQALLDENIDPVIILQDAMATAMFTLGAMWSRGEVFLPEVVASATLFKMCNEMVEPALLTTTVPQQKVVIEALKKEGLFDSIKVMVGGAPVTQEWADEIGADGFAPDAPEAVSRAQALLGIEVAA